MRRFLFLPVIMALFACSFSAPADSFDVSGGYSLLKGFDTQGGTIDSGGDFVEICNLKIPGAQKGCVFTLVVPKVTGERDTTTDSVAVAAMLGIQAFDGSDRLLYQLYTKDSLLDTASYRFVLPIETPVAPADKYKLFFYGDTTMVGKTIVPPGKIYALKPTVRQD